MVVVVTTLLGLHAGGQVCHTWVEMVLGMEMCTAQHTHVKKTTSLLLFEKISVLQHFSATERVEFCSPLASRPSPAMGNSTSKQNRLTRKQQVRFSST